MRQSRTPSRQPSADSARTIALEALKARANRGLPQRPRAHSVDDSVSQTAPPSGTNNTENTSPTIGLFHTVFSGIHSFIADANSPEPTIEITRQSPSRPDTTYKNPVDEFINSVSTWYNKIIDFCRQQPNLDQTFASIITQLNKERSGEKQESVIQTMTDIAACINKGSVLHEAFQQLSAAFATLNTTLAAREHSAEESKLEKIINTLDGRLSSLFILIEKTTSLEIQFLTPKIQILNTYINKMPTTHQSIAKFKQLLVQYEDMGAVLTDIPGKINLLLKEINKTPYIDRHKKLALEGEIRKLEQLAIDFFKNKDITLLMSSRILPKEIIASQPNLQQNAAKSFANTTASIFVEKLQQKQATASPQDIALPTRTRANSAAAITTTPTPIILQPAPVTNTTSQNRRKQSVASLIDELREKQKQKLEPTGKANDTSHTPTNIRDNPAQTYGRS